MVYAEIEMICEKLPELDPKEGVTFNILGLTEAEYKTSDQNYRKQLRAKVFFTIDPNDSSSDGKFHRIFRLISGNQNLLINSYSLRDNPR